MGSQLLVEEIDAAKEFAREFNDYAPVSACFWLNPAESDHWYLYVASDEINDTNIYVAYGEVLRRVGIGQWLDPFKIKLVNTSDPVARDAIKIRDSIPNRTIPVRRRGGALGNLGIEGAYIYPPLTKASATP
jgi:hypothetical protein